MATTPDAVDAILAQWQRERPDLDCTVMAPIGRLARAQILMQREVEKAYSAFDLVYWEFDVLATLRRSGSPYCLAPTELFAQTMVTSGTMTHRLKQLEKRALIERHANPQDARSLLVKLSPAGLTLVDQVVTAHVANEQRILAKLSAAQVSALDQALRQLLQVLNEDN